MDTTALTQLMMRTAKRDVFQGKGRIIIPEFQREKQLKLSVMDLIRAWKQTYPFFPIEQKMNVLIISFEG